MKFENRIEKATNFIKINNVCLHRCKEDNAFQNNIKVYNTGRFCEKFTVVEESYSKASFIKNPHYKIVAMA